MFAKTYTHIKNKTSGFTLVEILVVIAVFVLIISAISTTYSKTINLLTYNKMKIDAIDLANEQIEILHNLPFADVGVVGGIPSGKLAHQFATTRDGSSFVVTTTIRNIDDPADGTLGGTPNDLSPADYKLAEVGVSCDRAYSAAQGATSSCLSFTPVSLTAIVAPKNLETASNNGALFVKVFDANGIAVSNAAVHISNTKVTPNITIDDTTDTNGLLQIVDAPTSTNGYSISVTKSGFSTDKTYPVVGSTTPYKTDSTVLVQQVTQTSLSIDQTSTINFSSINASCAAVPSVRFKMVGGKLISVNNPKSTSTITTDAGGNYTMNNVEWDTYSITPFDLTYDIIGLNPISPISVLPGSTQPISIMVEPKNPNIVLVNVKDGSSNLPLSDAIVTLSSGSSSATLQTGRGFVRQTNWSGGAGQTDFSNQTRFDTSSNINYSGVTGQITLAAGFSSGNLTSSIIDMGTATNFNQILWAPTSQPVQTGAATSSVRLQIATSNTNNATTTWTYVGPDRTSGTYFTTANQTINAAQNGTQYIRYKVYLSTANNAYTPTIADVSLTFTSSCVPPGQVVFDGLSSGTYNLSVTRSGYTSYAGTVDVSTAWQVSNISMNP